jgi:acetyl esterase/lipase
VLWLHGGGWMVGDSTGPAIAGLDWPLTLAELAGRGYVVASVAYRLSGEARYPAQIHDVRAAIRWLRANASSHGIDATRIVAMGGSAGAYLAVLAGVSCGDASLDAPPMPARRGAPLATTAVPATGSECVSGVVAFYPPVDLPLLAKVPYNGIPGESADSAVGRLLGCAMASCTQATLASAAILARVDAKDPPMLLIHGDADTAVPIDQSRRLDAALRAAGVASELLVIPGANHVLPGLAASKQREILDRVWRFVDQRSRQ